jgi:quercetin dioxygenase-like cupin family protein
MDVKRSGSNPSQKAPADHFSGIVRIGPLFQSNAPARVGGAYVTFEPCARSDGHTHPLGQTRKSRRNSTARGCRHRTRPRF